MQELDNQYFTYRQSPALVNGKARIKSIKGNTLVWNQLVQNGNFASTSNWLQSGTVTFTVSNNKATVVCQQWRGIYQQISAVSNHKYLMVATCKQSGTSVAQMIFREKDSSQTTVTGTSADITNTEQTISVIKQCESNTAYIQMIFQNNGADEKTIEIKNVMLFDLTQLNDSRITDYNSFRNYFSLPYYAYGQYLLNFNGSGVKTTGKNLFDKASVTANKTINANGEIVNGTHYVSDYIPVFPNTDYYLSDVVSASSGRSGFFYDGNKNGISVASFNPASATSGKITTPADALYIRITTDNINDCQVEIGSSPSTYEPYTSSTLSLPISTYFPTGMKSAGSVYDELTESKAITRVLETVVDGTNKVASYYGTFEGHQLFYVDVFSNTSASAEFDMCLVSNKYTTYDVATMPDKGIRYQGVPAQTINIGRVYWTDDSYTSASAMNTALQSSPLVINSVLATYTEQDVDPEDTQIMLNRALSTVLGRNVSVDNPQEALDILTKGE